MGGFHYEEWLARVPESIKQDPLWDFQVYPKALLLSDLAWEDASRMMKDPLLDEIIAALVLSSERQRQYRKR